MCSEPYTYCISNARLSIESSPFFKHILIVTLIFIKEHFWFETGSKKRHVVITERIFFISRFCPWKELLLIMKGSKSHRFKTSLLVGALSASVKCQSHVAWCIPDHFWTLDVFVFPMGADLAYENSFECLNEIVARAIVYWGSIFVLLTELYISKWCYTSNCLAVFIWSF